MRFEYLKIWSRWYWLPYKEETVLDMSFRWLCFEAQFKRQPTQPAPDWRESAPSAEPDSRPSIVPAVEQQSVQPTIEGERIIRAMDMDDVRNPRYKISG